MLQFFRRRLRRDERGFTLIELLIVVAIIAILAAILIPNFLRARSQSMVSAARGNIKNLATALESYFVDFGAYPATGSLPLLVTVGTPQSYVRAIPRDPCTNALYSANGAQADGVPWYTNTGGAMGDNYVLGVDFTNTRCEGMAQNGGSTIYYTPGGGLQEVP